MPRHMVALLAAVAAVLAVLAPLARGYLQWLVLAVIAAAAGLVAYATAPRVLGAALKKNATCAAIFSR
jgi:hypothetical protein